jgi:single-stranded-DNA-specific exonuclease
MQKRWEIDTILGKEDKQTVKNIASDLKCPFIIAELLFKKGLKTMEQFDSFFKPSMNMLHDPFLFNDMEKAAKRIINAVDTGEKITIYGDYDVDGTTATALLYLGLKKLNAVVDYYIPHRMIDGYGLSLSGLEHLRDSGSSLIISVDCGIIALDEVEAINNMGMQIIITDHHNSKQEKPAAYAIINPKLQDCGYPFKDLAGVGVAYKLLMAIYSKLGLFNEENNLEYLDLVAVGTIADIVPLTDENRVFATYGLQHLANRKNIGLNALLNIAGILNRSPEANDIVFALAPRINAAGRMGSAMRAVELLITEDIAKSEELAEIIERENSLRQQIDQKTFQEAEEIINKKYKNLDETPCMVVSSDNWHPGVIGIVSSKIVEKYYRPTIMISYNEGVGSGSGRSVSEFDLFHALEDCDDLLDSYGGHKYAVGLTILPEYTDTLENRLAKFIKNTVNIQDLRPALRINKKLELYEITYKLMDWLYRFSPFGAENWTPVFYTEQVMVHGYPYTVGKNHLKLKVSKDGCELDLIGFNLGDYLPLLKNNSYLDIVYTLELVSWQGKTTIQGNLKDIHLK